MLKATNAKHIAAIAKWVRDGTTNHDTRPAVVAYLSIREYTDCELDGCVKYEAYWLALGKIKYQKFYIDAKTDKIVHVTRDP